MMSRARRYRGQREQLTEVALVPLAIRNKPGDKTVGKGSCGKATQRGSD
jgi:hypothetical protein